GPARARGKGKGAGRIPRPFTAVAAYCLVVEVSVERVDSTPLPDFSMRVVSDLLSVLSVPFASGFGASMVTLVDDEEGGVSGLTTVVDDSAGAPGWTTVLEAVLVGGVDSFSTTAPGSFTTV